VTPRRGLREDHRGDPLHAARGRSRCRDAGKLRHNDDKPQRRFRFLSRSFKRRCRPETSSRTGFDHMGRPSRTSVVVMTATWGAGSTTGPRTLGRCRQRWGASLCGMAIAGHVDARHVQYRKGRVHPALHRKVHPAVPSFINRLGGRRSSACARRSRWRGLSDSDGPNSGHRETPNP
jgi:hypothetical protein